MANFPFFSRKKQAQNESHLRNLILLAKSDNQISKTEVDCIFRIGMERGFNKEAIKTMIKEPTKGELFIPESTQEKFDQLFDLTMVMLADGIIEDDEMEFCTNFSNQLGFRKTVSWLLVLHILEGIEKGDTKTVIYKNWKNATSSSLAH